MSHHNDMGTAALLHPNDMILEQSNDDDEDDSSMEQLPKRIVNILGEAENISLIEEDYVVVDPITESYRSGQKCYESNARRSFFEENLMAMSGNTTTSPPTMA